MKNRFNQYKLSINNGDCNLRNFMFCLLLRDHLGFKFEELANLSNKTIKFNGIDIKIKLVEELFLKLKLHV
jgi:hypothetical protein